MNFIQRFSCFTAMALIAGCNSGDNNTPPINTQAVPRRALQPVAESKVNSAPVFIEIERPQLDNFASDESGPRIAIEQTLFKKPEFYSGKMPLKYLSIKRQIGFNEKYTVSDDFNEWKNEYAYAEPAHKFAGIADGARAVDKHGQVRAEAQLIRIIPGRALEVEEFHYADDGVTFHCKSEFSLVLGHKTKESDTKGVKERDYFFQWPVHGF